MANILVLGGSYLQAEFIKTAVNQKHNVTVIDRNKYCYACKIDGCTFKQIDIADEENVLLVARELNVDAIIPPANELGNIISARVSHQLGLLYNSETVVHATIDKQLLRKKLKDTDIEFPKAYKYKKGIEEKLSYPVIVKPSNNSAGRGVSFSESYEEMCNSLSYARKYVKEHGCIIVEEYIRGVQLSIETVSNKSGHHVIGITRENISQPPFFLERSHVISRELYYHHYKKVSAFAKKLLTLLDVKVGPAHIEVILKDGDFYLIDVATRSGGWRDYLLKYARANNYNEEILHSYIGSENKVGHDIAPKTTVAVNILMYPSDLQAYLRAKHEGIIVDEYFNSQGPELIPKNLTDSFGYFYIRSENINEYLLT